MKVAKSKNSQYSPILQDCMNTSSETAKFRKFRILLDNESSSTIVMGKLKLKLKEKNKQKQLCGKPDRGSSRHQRR